MGLDNDGWKMEEWTALGHGMDGQWMSGRSGARVRSRCARAGDNYQPLAVIRVEHLNTAGMHTGHASKFGAQLLDLPALPGKIKSLRHPSLVDASPSHL